MKKSCDPTYYQQVAATLGGVPPHNGGAKGKVAYEHSKKQKKKKFVRCGMCRSARVGGMDLTNDKLPVWLICFELL